MSKPGMAQVDFDSVAPLRPADHTAGRVASNGDHWEPKAQMPAGLEHWDAPPPMRPWQPDPRDPSLPDLTGRKFDKLTVMGLWNETRGGSGVPSRWVVRCACGSYEVRRPSSILTGIARNQGHCWNCDQLNRIKRDYERLGSRPISDFTTGQSPVEAKSPVETKPQRDLHKVIAGHIPSRGDRDRIAKLIIADLTRNGYRIVRDKAK